MSDNPEAKIDKKAALREKLVSATTELIEKNGTLGLRARDLADAAGCALGGLYTVYSDLDALVTEVNSRTLMALDAEVDDAINTNTSPGEQLRFLGLRYLAFARAKPRLWRALFEHRLPEGKHFPDWHLANQSKLLAHIAKPLAQLQPSLDQQTLMLRARTLFAAVHGIVSISLDNRFVGLPTETLDQEIDSFICILLAGLKQDQSMTSSAP